MEYWHIPNAFSLFPPHGLNFIEDLIGISMFIIVHFLLAPGAVLFLIIVLLTPILRWFLFAYMCWIFYDYKVSERGGREIPLFRWFPLFKCYKNYFPIKIQVLQGVLLEPRKNYMFCQFPHGRGTGFGCATWFMDEGFGSIFVHHNARMVSLNIFFFIPFLREIFLAMGSIGSSVEALDYLLRNEEGGNIVALMVGGVEEVLLAEPGTYKIVLKNRKGFIRIALKNGTPLVPVFSFREVDHIEYVNYNWWKSIQNFVREYFHVPFQIPTTIIPKKVPITVVVGHPIDVEKIEDPSDEDVDKWHEIFTQALINLFESEKHKYLEDAENCHLEIF